MYISLLDLRIGEKYHIRILIIISLYLVRKGIYFLVVPPRQLARKSTINDT